MDDLTQIQALSSVILNKLEELMDWGRMKFKTKKSSTQKMNLSQS